MLSSASERYRLLHSITLDLQAGKIDTAAAEERLCAIGEDALVCGMRGEDRQRAGDVDGAEGWFWKGLDLQPARFTFYLSLAETRQRRDANDPLARRLGELALWKLGDSTEIKEPIAEYFRTHIGSEGLDFRAPETYEMMATVEEVRRKENAKEDPPEVLDRLLPYLLLNDLQHQAPDMVEHRVVAEILQNAGRCMPLLRAAVLDWARTQEDVRSEAVAMFMALLGEIGEVDVVPDLLELATTADSAIFLHANWALCRLGERFPERALAAFRHRAVDAPVALRCAIAEHMAMMPDELDAGPAAQTLLDGFRGFAKREDAAYLLLVVLFILGRRSDERGAAVLARYLEMLPKKARAWMMEILQSEDSFVPKLMEEGIDELDIDDVCIRRILLVEEDDEDDEDEGLDEDEEEEPTTPAIAFPKPGRNDACWCGSGKKYKKCHLAADQAAEQSGSPAPRPGIQESASENDSQAHKRLGNLVLSAVHDWFREDEMRRAFTLYFGSNPQAIQTNAETEDLFLQWYLHDYRPRSTGRTAFAEYLRREGSRFSSRDRTMLESMRDARYGLYEVQRVEPGRGIEVRDFYRDDQLFIDDVSVTKELVPWDCILGRVENREGRYVFSGNGQMVPRMLLDRLNQFIEAESRNARQSPGDFVIANCHLLSRKLTELHSEQAAGLTIADGTGEPMEFSSAKYRILGAEASILAILRGIEGLREQTSVGNLDSHHNFAWVETGVEGPAKVFGEIEIAFDRIKLSCTSRRRLEMGRQLLETKLGELLRHEEDRFETVEEAMQRTEREGLEAAPKPPAQRVDPEIEREVVLKMKAEHYAKWVDEALPALGGKTPREAVRTADGLRVVRHLVRGIENIEARERRKGGPALDLGGLRRTLGLTEE